MSDQEHQKLLKENADLKIERSQWMRRETAYRKLLNTIAEFAVDKTRETLEDGDSKTRKM